MRMIPVQGGVDRLCPNFLELCAAALIAAISLIQIPELEPRCVPAPVNVGANIGPNSCTSYPSTGVSTLSSVRCPVCPP